MKKYPKNAFWLQRRNAKDRGIEFCFTFAEWVAWWEHHLGPQWFELRGCRRGQYVMARHGDCGAYHPDNVRCITVTANVKEQFNKGGSVARRNQMRKPHQGGIKITPLQALTIYGDRRTQRAIAREYGISERLVRLIKNKQVWKATLPSCSPPVKA